MNEENYIEANRVAWNEVSSIHAHHSFESLKNNFQIPSYNCLDSIATQILKDISIENKSVAQLGCNNGRELLAIKNLGAGRCVGFDIAEGFIQQASQLAASSKIHCEFVCCEIFKIPEYYYNQFEVIYISAGVLHWLPDLTKLFEIVSVLLKPAGYLFIYEIHPILGLFNETDKQDPPKIVNSYFEKQPKLDEAGLDYIGNTKYVPSSAYLFQHKLSDILSCCIELNMNIEHFCEYSHDISSVFTHIEKITTQLPLSYTLVTKKK